MNDELSTFFSGKKLFGDGFNMDEINGWFTDEAEGYENLGSREQKQYKYGCHQLNCQHGFKDINKMLFNEAWGIGSAYGDELKSIVNNINKIRILDPSDTFSGVKEIVGTLCDYIKPNSTRNMPFASNQFDLITCLGVMHHIPNVMHVMGDWRRPRKRLTKKERGISLEIMDKIAHNIIFKIKYRMLCSFSLISKLTNKMGVSAYNSYTVTMADFLLSQLFSWNIKCHRTKLREKFAPA